MEIKKTEKASLENKRVLFVEVGLVVALLIVLLGFGWSTKDARVSMLVDTTRPDEESDITCIELPSPPQPEVPELPKLSDVIDIVDDDIKLDEDLFVNLEENGQEYDIISCFWGEDVEEEEEDEVVPFILVEQKPTFNKGDANDFSKWVNSRLVYPEKAKEMGIQGRVTLSFTVEADGRVADVRVLRGVDEILDKEAVRVVSSSPKWEPGRQRDRAVRVSYTFPVIFQLR